MFFNDFESCMQVEILLFRLWKVFFFYKKIANCEILMINIFDYIICCWYSSLYCTRRQRLPMKFWANPLQQYRTTWGLIIFWSFSTGTASIRFVEHLIFGQHHSLSTLSTSSCSITRTISSRISSRSQTFGPDKIPSGSESINRHQTEKRLMKSMRRMEYFQSTLNFPLHLPISQYFPWYP